MGSAKHGLLFATAGGEVAGMSSEDADYVNKVRVAIEAAIQMQ